MGIDVRIRNGLCPDPSTGEGGATEGDIRGSFSDIIDVIGVKDLVGGHCLVTEDSPQGLSVLVADGVVYIPNSDYDELDSNEPKFYEAILKDIPALEIAENTSGSTRIDLVCVKVDKTIVPDEHASNISTPIIVQGTPGAGAPTLPDNHSQLAEIEVANGAATIVNADITDSRVQADINGAYVKKSNGLTFTEISEPDTPAANKIIVYAKDVGGVSKLFFKQDDGTEVEIGAGGGGSTDGWNSASETWTYVSTDDPTGIFKVNADVTTKYSAGMRIKMTNGGNVIYGIITVINAYGADEAGYTYIKFLHEIDPTDSLALYLMANSAITLNYYSTQKVPYGFPVDETKWRIRVTDGTQRSQANPTQDTWYNLEPTTISIPIGYWKVKYKVFMEAYQVSAVQCDMESTLSTTNNSESNEDFTVRVGHSAPSGVQVARATAIMENPITLTSKTVYYLNAKQTTASMTEMYFTNSVIPMIITATCAYL